jgi:Flp pilus assembly protein TadG
MVEFAAVLLPVMMILVGIIQFGFVFGAYVGTSNAAREGARAGSVYVYDTTESQAVNDQARCAAILAAVSPAIDPGMPGSFSGSCATAYGDGDGLVISYPNSASCTATSRSGCQLNVRVGFDQPLFVPLLGQILDGDGDNQIRLTADVTVVVN